MPPTVQELEDAMISLDRVKIRSILSSQDSVSDFLTTLEHIVVPVMQSIGTRWENGNVALSQVYMSGKILEEIVDELLPTTQSKRVNDPKLGLLIYKDYHMLGKRIVYTFLRASGYDVIDYGPQHEVSTIIEMIKNDSIEILLISVLMLNSAINLKELISKIKEEKLSVKVVVGGAPFRFDKELCKEIGADAFATNASQAIEIIERLRK